MALMVTCFWRCKRATSSQPFWLILYSRVLDGKAAANQLRKPYSVSRATGSDVGLMLLSRGAVVVVVPSKGQLFAMVNIPTCPDDSNLPPRTRLHIS